MRIYAQGETEIQFCENYFGVFCYSNLTNTNKSSISKCSIFQITLSDKGIWKQNSTLFQKNIRQVWAGRFHVMGFKKLFKHFTGHSNLGEYIKKSRNGNANKSAFRIILVEPLCVDSSNNSEQEVFPDNGL